jgi:hypothetical protein
MEGVTKVVAEAALKKARDQLKAIRTALIDTSAEQILEGAELQQLRAEAAVDGGGALLDFADTVLSGVSIVPGLGSVCAVLKSVVGVGRNVHELAEDALKITDSAFEIGRYLIDMERLAMRMEEESKAELQYHMSSLRELVGDMQEAIMVFGRKGFFRKMLVSAKLVRKVTTIERRKEATLKAMDRILQTVQTELMLDTKDRVQLETKEHTYALAEAVWAKVEEHTKTKGGDVDVEANVTNAAEEIMRSPAMMKQVADSAGLSEVVFKEEMELIHEKLEEIEAAVHGEGIQTRAEIKGAVRGEGIQTRAEMDVHYARSAQARLDDNKAELSRLAREYRLQAFRLDDLQGVATAETRLNDLLQHPSGFMGNAVLSPAARIVKELQVKGTPFKELQLLVLPESSARSPMSDDGRSGDGVSSIMPRRSISSPLVHGADGSEIATPGADTVGVFCCHIPYTDAHSSEVAGASRVAGEKKVLVTTERAHILLPASIESMNDAIAQFNPRGVHIAGHNQVQFVHISLMLTLTCLSLQYFIDQMRIVGFSSIGNSDSDSDDGNELITECSPELLAEYIVDPALTNGKRCRLEVVVLNACDSLPFAQVRHCTTVMVYIDPFCSTGVDHACSRPIDQAPSGMLARTDGRSHMPSVHPRILQAEAAMRPAIRRGLGAGVP